MEANPVAQYYETWWISPDGVVHDAVARGVPGHCRWLEERFGICSRPEAREKGWIRIGWNMGQFYIDGRPERIEAERATIEDLMVRHPNVHRVLLEHGSDLDTVLTPEEFFERRPRGR